LGSSEITHPQRLPVEHRLFRISVVSAKGSCRKFQGRSGFTGHHETPFQPGKNGAI
jgi:hypothetical protein